MDGMDGLRCGGCGAQVFPQARYCPGCGVRLREPCSRCGTLPVVSARFCHWCGLPLQSRCSTCGQSLPDPAVERAQGGRLEQPAPPAAPPVAQQPAAPVAPPVVRQPGGPAAPPVVEQPGGFVAPPAVQQPARPSAPSRPIRARRSPRRGFVPPVDSQAPSPAASPAPPTPPASPTPPSPPSSPSTPLAGERRLVTILFADVSGFTAMSERLDHEEVNQVMRACWTELDRVVLDYGGTVDKHIGDALMATFGAITAHEDDALRAVQVGLALQQRLADFSARLKAATGLTLRMRCGIAAGEVTVDSVADSTQERSVIGPSVNLASRLEHECTVGSVFVNREVYRATEWAIEYRPLDPRPIKGIDGLVPIYEAIGEREAGLRRPDRPTAASHGLVGRGAERTALREALVDALEGRARVVALVGEAGMGKSTLVATLREVAREKEVRWVTGRALSYSATHPYALVREALRDLLEVDGRTPAGTVLAHLASALSAEEGNGIGPGGGGAALSRDDRLALLSRLLLAEDAVARTVGRGEGSAAFVEALDPRMRHRLTVQAARDLFVAQGRRGPLVLNLEDLHFCDPESLEVAGAVASALSGERLLLLAQTRPIPEPAWWGMPHARVLRLPPFSPEESAVLVGALLAREGETRGRGDAGTRGQGDEGTGEVAARLHEATQGNPYFIVEMVRSLLEKGQIARSRDGWKLSEEARQLPSTVRGLLQARMDALEPTPRLVLQEASVVGDTFDAPTVEANGAEPPAVRPSLPVLVERELIQPVGDAETRGLGDGEMGRREDGEVAMSGEGDRDRDAAIEQEGTEEDSATQGHDSSAEDATSPPPRVSASPRPPVPYRFRRGLLRETAYQTLSRRRREQYHRRLGELLEKKLDLAVDAGAVEVLAHHFTNSDRADRALHYALLAAERAAVHYANQSALFWYDRAGEALDRLEQGSIPGAAVARERAEPVATAAGRVRLLEGRAAVESLLGQYPAAREHLEAALALCEGAQDSGLATRDPSLARHVPELCRRLARVHESQGDYEGGLGWVDRGLVAAGATWDAGETALAPPPPDLDAAPVARLCLVAGVIHWRCGRQAGASIWSRRGMALAESAGPAAAQDLAQTYNLLGILARHEGRPEESEAYCRESLVRYEALGDIVGADKAHTNLAFALLDQGKLTGALEHLKRSEELAGRIGDPVRRATAETNMGHIYMHHGELEKARLCYEEALPTFEGVGHAYNAATCRMDLAWLNLTLGAGEVALAMVTAAQEAFTGLGTLHHLSEVLRHRTLALLMLGRKEEALAAAEESLARAREMGKRLEEGQALRALGQVRVALGDAAAALPLFETSRLLLEEMNARQEVGLTLLEQARALAAGRNGKDRLEGREGTAVSLSSAPSLPSALLSRAMDLFRESGATRDLAAAEELLRSLAGERT